MLKLHATQTYQCAAQDQPENQAPLGRTSLVARQLTDFVAPSTLTFALRRSAVRRTGGMIGVISYFGSCSASVSASYTLPMSARIPLCTIARSLTALRQHGILQTGVSSANFGLRASAVPPGCCRSKPVHRSMQTARREHNLEDHLCNALADFCALLLKASQDKQAAHLCVV